MRVNFCGCQAVIADDAGNIADSDVIPAAEQRGGDCQVGGVIGDAPVGRHLIDRHAVLGNEQAGEAGLLDKAFGILTDIDA